MRLAVAAGAPNQLRIRTATLADLPILIRISEQTPELPQWSPSHYNSLFDQQAASLVRTMLVGTVRDEVVAFGVLALLTSVAPPEGEVENLAVSPQQRRQGIGRAMLMELLDRARSAGAAFVDLEVRAGNAAALALYSRAGFEMMGRRPRYYRQPVEDAVLLRVHLGGRHEASGMIED